MEILLDDQLFVAAQVQMVHILGVVGASPFLENKRLVRIPWAFAAVDLAAEQVGLVVAAGDVVVVAVAHWFAFDFATYLLLLEVGVPDRHRWYCYSRCLNHYQVLVWERFRCSEPMKSRVVLALAHVVLGVAFVTCAVPYHTKVDISYQEIEDSSSASSLEIGRAHV